MKVLVSWSGQRGRIVAEALRSWLADVLHRTDAWVSSEDIEPGTRWNSELAKQLEETQFGIVCLTPESAHAPWVLFEAGALAKTLGTARLVPYSSSSRVANSNNRSRSSTLCARISRAR